MPKKLVAFIIFVAALGGGVVLKQLGLPVWIVLLCAIVAGGLAFWYFKRNP